MIAIRKDKIAIRKDMIAIRKDKIAIRKDMIAIRKDMAQQFNVPYLRIWTFDGFLSFVGGSTALTI